MAIFGILLKSSKTVVKNIVESFLGNDVDQNQMNELVTFILDNADGLSIALIVIGLALAALCLLGCIASCCGWNILLKIVSRFGNLFARRCSLE